MLVERAPGHEAVSENAAVKRLASALRVSERVEQEAQRILRIASGYIASRRIERLETGAIFLALESVYIREKSYGNLRSIEEIALANFGKDYNFALHDRVVRNAAEYLLNERIAEPTMVPRENYVRRWIGIIVGKIRIGEAAQSVVAKRAIDIMGNNPLVESWMGSAHLTAASVVKAAAPEIGIDQLARAVGQLSSEGIIRQKALEFADSMALQMPHGSYAERLARKHAVAVRPSGSAVQGVSLSEAVVSEQARTKRNMLRPDAAGSSGAKSGARRDSQTDAWITSIARDIGADDRTQEIASGLLTLDDKIRARFTSLHQNWRAYLAGGLIHLASIRRAAEAGADGYLYLRTRAEIVNSNTIRNLDEKVNWNTHETAIGRTIRTASRLIGMRAGEFPQRIEFAKRQVKVMCDRMGLDDKIRLEVNSAIGKLASEQGEGAVNSPRMLGKILVAARRHGRDANPNGLWLPLNVVKLGQQYARKEAEEQE